MRNPHIEDSSMHTFREFIKSVETVIPPESGD